MNTNSRTKNSIMNIVTGFGSNILLTIIRFACRTVLISTLSSAYLGINGLFSDILTMLSLSELGIDTAINFKLYKPIAENDTARLRVLMKFYRSAYRVIGIVILALGLCLIPFLPFLIKDYNSIIELGLNPVLIFCLYLFHSASSYLFFAYKTSILKANQQEYIISLTGLISQFVLNICQIITLIIFKDFTIYVALSIVFSILSNLILTIITKRKYKSVFEKTDDKMSKAEIKDLFKDLGATFIQKVNGIVLKVTDNFVISAFIGIVTVGIYSNYLLIYSTIRTFLARFFSSTKASLGNLYATSTIEKKYAFFEVSNFIAFILYGTAAVGIAVCANEVLTCWIGTSYTIAQPFPILIGIEILLLGIKVVLDQVRNISGVFRQMWYRPIIGIVVNIIVSVVLVQFIGIYGVILGTIAADVIANFTVDPRIIHKYSFENYKPVSRYYKKHLAYAVVLVLVGAADMLLCNFVLTGLGWLSVIVHILICAVSVPLAFALVFNKSHEFKYLFSLAQKLLKK